MRIIPTRLHGLLDYSLGLLLILSPWLLGFGRGGAETLVPLALGVAIFVYSLMTDYELGVGRVFAMPTHLGLDAVSGLALIASPWLFGFAAHVLLPHLGLGLGLLGLALLTRRRPDFHAMRH